MNKRVLYLDEVDRVVPTAQASFLAAMREPVFKGSWLRRMWWKLSGRGPRYRLLFTHGTETDEQGKQHDMTRAELDALAQTCATGKVCIPKEAKGEEQS